MTQGILLGTHLDTGDPFYISNQRLATKKGFLIGQSEAGKPWAAAVAVEGKRQAYPIAIFGGKRGHYRLTPDIGNAIARTVYSKRWSEAAETPASSRKAASAPAHTRAADAELRHTLHETQAELTALRTAFDELQTQNAALEADVQQRLRLAEESAAREANARLQHVQSVLAQVVAQLQPLVSADNPDAPVPSASLAPMSRVKRLEQQVEEHPRITSAGKKIIRVLVAEYPDFPNGLPKAKLASYAKLTAGGGAWNKAVSDLKARRYLVAGANGDLALNPDML